MTTGSLYNPSSHSNEPNRKLDERELLFYSLSPLISWAFPTALFMVPIVFKPQVVVKSLMQISPLSLLLALSIFGWSIKQIINVIQVSLIHNYSIPLID